MQLHLDPVVRFRSGLSDKLLVAIVAALIKASNAAYENCRERHSRFPLGHVLGQDRYYALQEAFLAVKDEFPELNIHLEQHPYGTSYYVVLDLPLIQITLAKVPHRKVNPPLKLFRRGYRVVQKHRPGQTAFAFAIIPPPKQRMIATVVYGYEGEDFAMPKFIEARFINELGFFMDQTLDLLAIYNKSLEVTIEEVKQTTPPTMRPNRQREKNKQA